VNTCADLPAKPLTDTAAFKILTGEDICKINGMQPKPINIFVTELLQSYGTFVQRKHELKTRRAIFQGICLNDEVA
jgi:hypothetical protein